MRQWIEWCLEHQMPIGTNLLIVLYCIYNIRQVITTNRAAP